MRGPDRTGTDLLPAIPAIVPYHGSWLGVLSLGLVGVRDDWYSLAVGCALVRPHPDSVTLGSSSSSHDECLATLHDACLRTGLGHVFLLSDPASTRSTVRTVCCADGLAVEVRARRYRSTKLYGAVPVPVGLVTPS